jgi:hypothetical protein
MSRVLSPGRGGGVEGRGNTREKMPAIATFGKVRINSVGDVQTETHLFVMKGYVTCYVCEEEDTCDEGVRDVSCV